MTLTILHIERYKAVAEAVQETLEAEGLRVVTCADGAAALTRLAGLTPCDLLITNNHGLEVVRHVRQLEHRARLPIVMFTGKDCRADARQAGVDVFLRKPEDLNKIVPTVLGLLDRGA